MYKISILPLKHHRISELGLTCAMVTNIFVNYMPKVWYLHIHDAHDSVRVAVEKHLHSFSEKSNLCNKSRQNRNHPIFSPFSEDFAR